MLGPIPVEIHVMDQLRRLRYTPPAHSPPWDPHYLWQKEDSEQVETMTGDDVLRESPPLASPASSPATPMPRRKAVLTDDATEACPGQLQQTSGQSRDQVTPRSSVHQTDASVDNAKQTHPGLGTMLDFFEDESFYYLVMLVFTLNKGGQNFLSSPLRWLHQQGSQQRCGYTAANSQVIRVQATLE